MRLFVSINLKDDVVEYVHKLQRQFCAMENARMSPTQHVHITLGFIGEVDPERVNCIKQVLRTQRFDPFRVFLAHAGCFGPIEQPRVIWLGVVPREPLVELQRKVKEALNGVSTPGLRKGKFEPHITVARVKQTSLPKVLAASVSAVEVPALEIRVDGFSLMQSILQPAGATYREVNFYPAQHK